MQMISIEKALAGGDLRSVKRNQFVVSSIKNQQEFDELFRLMVHKDRLVVMRAADAIEKITKDKPTYLTKHKKVILDLASLAENKELQWHLAQLMPRLTLDKIEFEHALSTLMQWAMDEKCSRIVRVNSLQALHDLALIRSEYNVHLELLYSKLEKEKIPSINARIKKLRNNH